MYVPRALPRRFRDLRFCFRESNFRTAASVSFRRLDVPKIFPEVLPRSHGEQGRVVFELFGRRSIVGQCFWLLVVGWQKVCYKDLLDLKVGGWVKFADGKYLFDGWTIFPAPMLHSDGLGVFQYLRVKGLLPRSFRKEHEHFFFTKIWQNHCEMFSEESTLGLKEQSEPYKDECERIIVMNTLVV